MTPRIVKLQVVSLMPEKKLTKAQAGQLGGLETAQRLGNEGMVALARSGGKATSQRHGRAHFIRLARKRWGQLGGKAAAE